jgi:hypothetical protein
MWTVVKSFAGLLGAKVLMPRAILLIDSYHVAPHAAAVEWNILGFLLVISRVIGHPSCQKFGVFLAHYDQGKPREI